MADTTTTTTTIPMVIQTHPEYAAQTKDELVDTERQKIQQITELVSEVKQDTKVINERIADARVSTNVEERNGIIANIKTATAEMKEKVVTAAKLENEVVEINAVLKDKHVEHDAKSGPTVVSTIPIPQ